MKLTITINCDGAAFEEIPMLEAARILRKVVDALPSAIPPSALILRDINGNVCGQVTVTKE